MRATITALLITFALIVGADAGASEQKAAARHQSMLLDEILESVARKTDTQFLVYQRVPTEIVTGPAHVRDITYPQLLSILQNNDLAAVMVEETVNIVPVAAVRQYPLPMIDSDDKTMPDNAWVTRVIRADNAMLKRLVPLLRPMVPHAGHLVADPDSNTMIVIAPYGVTQQISKLVMTLDSHTPAQPEQVAQTP